MINRLGRVIPILGLFLVTAASSANKVVVIDGEFETQTFQVPGGQGYRHMTAFISDIKKEMVLFGGLGNGPPSPPTPMNHNIYSIDLKKPLAQQEFKLRGTDNVVDSPWFTSTRGFVDSGGTYFLACSDTNDDAVYSFDPRTFRFSFLSRSTLGAEIAAGDCCAVAMKVPDIFTAYEYDWEERIYILGGRNDTSPVVPYVRYYSITYNRWGRAPDLNVPRSHLGCAMAKPKGRPVLYAVGGGDSTQGVALRSMEVYDLLSDKWTLYENFLPQGRTRLGVQNFENSYLMLIGGDTACAGGGPGNRCTGDHPLTSVDLVDLKNGNRFISSADNVIPQLSTPRQTPATAISKVTKGGKNSYTLYVTAGRTINDGTLGVATSTETLSFDGINVRTTWVP